MPILLYGAIVVLVAAGFQILRLLRRGQIKPGRGLLYAAISLAGAFALIHGGAAYLTWKYKERAEAPVIGALMISSLTKGYFGGKKLLPSIKIIDYSPYGGHALATFENGDRFSVRFSPADDNFLLGRAVTPAEYTWLGL